MNTQNEKPDLPSLMLVIVVLLLAFAAVGTTDYADALERENRQLKAAAAGCRLAQAMRAPDEREATHE